MLRLGVSECVSHLSLNNTTTLLAVLYGKKGPRGGACSSEKSQNAKMCRLQFSEPSAQPFSEAHDAEFEDDALEALLALRTDHGMDFELSEEAALPNVDAAAAEAFQQSGLTNAGKDSSRYHCPFPGCKRSFQELWRLKVHYRCVGEQS